MLYVGGMIRAERLRRGWSQEGLCSGICATSYLSKIEHGKVEPSPQVLELLLKRLDLPWREAPEAAKKLQAAFEALFDGRFDAARALEAALAPEQERLALSPLAGEARLLRAWLVVEEPLPAALETGLNQRLLALQRCMEGRYDQALQLYPGAYIYHCAGVSAYTSGSSYPKAIELFQTSYDIAAREGRAHLMLLSKLYLGNCYANLRDLENMQRHYDVALRLCRALGDLQNEAAIGYNVASTQLEVGQYEESYAYFSTLEAPEVLALHKLAIACEKLGKLEEAQSAVRRGLAMASQTEQPLQREMFELVQLRLENPEYLKNEAYGKRLLAFFAACRQQLPIGFAAFHLPWVLEYYQATRQYRRACKLLQSFPIKPKIT